MAPRRLMVAKWYFLSCVRVPGIGFVAVSSFKFSFPTSLVWFAACVCSSCTQAHLVQCLCVSTRDRSLSRCGAWNRVSEAD